MIRGMPELPTGTVTFLFSDIEGSTRLLQELGDEYADALEEHRRIIRDSFGRRGGIEVGTQGDSFFVVFTQAADAVAAATDAQAGLGRTSIRVRMGLHTGEALLQGCDYVGLEVHRAARIAAAGHGGQVVISQATRDLLDSGIEVQDLGLHKLKDLRAPERLWQVGDGEFPPLRSLNQTNLPVQPTPLIGRERELGEVLALVRSHRLITLSGPGGSGKTRLALQAAAEVVQEFPDGVWFVSLAALRDPRAVLPTIAQTLGLRQTEPVEHHLENKKTLLLLDNFEQLLEAAADLAELLRQAPSLKALVTSRSRLRLGGEQEYAVPPLADDEAVALFAERVRAARPGFEPDEHVGEICRRLDNLPLAVELAAARTNVLVPAQLLERLEQRLPLLSGGARDAPERQRTLRSTIDWSYDLLGDEERQLFRRLAVFAGSFDLEAAEEVCDADLDGLGSLLDKSLLRQTVDGRFFMLETIREYAAERFREDPEADALRRRHAEHTLRVAEDAKALRHQGYDRLESEHDNARAALDYLCVAGDAELALRLAIAFGDYWFVRGHVREGRRRTEEALALAGPAPGELRLDALSRASRLAGVAGDADLAAEHASNAVALAEELHDAPALAVALTALGEAVVNAGDYDRGISIYEQALAVARETGQTPVPILTNLADAALGAGEPDRAIEYSKQAAELADGHDRDTVRAIAAFNIASALIQLERVADARPRLLEALEAVLRLEYPELLGWCLTAAAAVATRRDGPDAALLVGAADGIMDSVGVAFGPAEQRLRGLVLSELRDRHPEAKVEELLHSGRDLDVEEAVGLARSYLD
jgi:predicted ATPase/class 3 adenylate cyclase